MCCSSAYYKIGIKLMEEGIFDSGDLRRAHYKAIVGDDVVLNSGGPKMTVA